MGKGSEKGKGGLKPGTLLQHGRYRIIRYISQGGFGCTYEAEHTMFNERVAIKELFISEYCNRNSETGAISVGVGSKKDLIDRLYRKFINEARAQRKMQHPNIVRVIDVFEENATAFYVMDYIEGDSLESIIQKRKSPMSEKEAVGYIRMVADALDYVHSQKCLHLDVKPGNIMIDKSGKAILIDFGASKQYDEQGSNASTVTGFTRGYAPIEQVGGHINTFSPASDIFSLGSTLYRLLTGELPVDSLGRMSGMNLKPLPADVSPATRRAVECSMNISIGDRPQTIREFLSLLDGDGDVVEEPEASGSPASNFRKKVALAAFSVLVICAVVYFLFAMPSKSSDVAKPQAAQKVERHVDEPIKQTASEIKTDAVPDGLDASGKNMTSPRGDNASKKPEESNKHDRTQKQKDSFTSKSITPTLKDLQDSISQRKGMPVDDSFTSESITPTKTLKDLQESISQRKGMPVDDSED